MDLTFRIIWFEDVDEWYNTVARRVTRYIEDKNFKVEIKHIEKASEFDLNKHELQNYDLLIVDYELEKIYKEDGDKRIYGTEIIRMIRDGNFYNDVLFYSSHGFDAINKEMKKEGLQGVFLADRNNDEFLEKLEHLVDKEGLAHAPSAEQGYELRPWACRQGFQFADFSFSSDDVFHGDAVF